MKYIYLTIFLCFCFFFGCSTHNTEKIDPCLSGYILFVYMGEQNKPIYPVLIRTDEKDSTYLQYIGSSQEKLEKNGFIIAELSYGKSFDNIIIDEKVFLTIKNYITINNTKIDKDIWNSDNNTIKIILSDKCDSLTYIVDKSNINYFTHLIDSVKIFDNKSLLDGLNYYKNIQESN